MSAFELGKPASALGLEDPAGALELVDVGAEGIVGERSKVLGPKLVERRSERAHAADDSERMFGCQ